MRIRFVIRVVMLNLCIHRNAQVQHFLSLSCSGVNTPLILGVPLGWRTIYLQSSGLSIGLQEGVAVSPLKLLAEAGGAQRPPPPTVVGLLIFVPSIVFDTVSSGLSWVHANVSLTTCTPGLAYRLADLTTCQYILSGFPALYEKEIP